MSITIILICLLAERFLLDYQDLRQADWFRRYSNWFHRQELPDWMHHGVMGIVTLLLPPLLVIALLQQLLGDALFGIPGALFACLVLLYSFGPMDLDNQVNQLIEATDAEDNSQINTIAHELLADDPPTSDTLFAQTVAESVLEQANNRIFAVIFWFMLLGPSGALLYRLATLIPRLELIGRESEALIACNRLIHFLDWVPARLTASAYAVAGSFEDALYGWRSLSERHADEFKNNASGILICTGAGALRLTTLLDQERGDETGSSLHYIAKAAMGLVWRSLIVWILLLFFFTLAGWI